jgi:esterase/lipase superfamily enzyme
VSDREQVELGTIGMDRPGTVVRYGHYGQPVLVFPSEQGRAWDYENNGMVDALRPLLDEGRVKLYCVDSFDHLSWSDRGAPLEQRARRHQDYEGWLLGAVVPFVRQDSPGSDEGGRGLVATGCSLGAFHALSLGLRHADVVDRVLALSGSYDPAQWHAWGERGDAAYFTNPTDYVQGLGGDHLDWLRSRLRTVLVVGQGPWEVDPTRSLPSTRAMAKLLQDKGIWCELDEWGHDSAHDWPWWQKQVAHHLPRLL